MKRVGECHACGQKRRILARNRCGPCYYQGAKRKCTHCGNTRHVRMSTKFGPMCAQCAAIYYPQICTICIQLRRVFARTAEGAAVCQHCYREECGTCHKSKQVAMRQADGAAVCPNCYLAATGRHGICPRCGGGPRQVACVSRTTGERICGSCRSREKELGFGRLRRYHTPESRPRAK